MNEYYLYEKKNDSIYKAYAFKNDILKLCRNSEFILQNEIEQYMKFEKETLKRLQGNSKILVSCSYSNLNGKN